MAVSNRVVDELTARVAELKAERDVLRAEVDQLKAELLHARKMFEYGG